MTKGRGLLGADGSSWEHLALFQHFGIPTRLLDWTDSFAVALFFATQEESEDAHIWVLNPFRLNAEYFDPPRLMTIGVDHVPDYFKTFIEYDDATRWPYDKPIAVEIPWANRRIQGQRGYFTVHQNSTPLDQSVKPCVSRVPIPRAALTRCREFCELAGVDEYSIFPDLQGLGAYLKTELAN